MKEELLDFELSFEELCDRVGEREGERVDERVDDGERGEDARGEPMRRTGLFLGAWGDVREDAREECRAGLNNVTREPPTCAPSSTFSEQPQLIGIRLRCIVLYMYQKKINPFTVCRFSLNFYFLLCTCVDRHVSQMRFLKKCNKGVCFCCELVYKL